STSGASGRERFASAKGKLKRSVSTLRSVSPRWSPATIGSSMSRPEPWAITAPMRAPVGHHSGTPSTPETAASSCCGSSSGMRISSKRALGSTKESLRGGCCYNTVIRALVWPGPRARSTLGAQLRGDSMEKVLVTGISGGQGRLLARRLLDTWEVTGVDRVPWEGRPKGVTVHVVDLRKRKFEDVIRTEQPTAVVHMGFVRHFRLPDRVR